MAADVKRHSCLKSIFVGILIYVLIDLSSTQTRRGPSRFPSRWGSRRSLPQRSRSQFRPRTIRIQSPLRDFPSSSFRPTRTFAGRDRIRSRPMETARTFASRNRVRSQPMETARTFASRNRVRSRPISFQTPSLAEVRVPSVQRSMIPIRDTNPGPVQVMSRSRSPIQMQRIQSFNDRFVDRRDQFRPASDNRQQQLPMRSAAVIVGGRLPSFARRQMPSRFSNLDRQQLDINNNGNLQTRRAPWTPRLSVSQNPQQPSFRVQQVSSRRSQIQRLPALRQRELTGSIESTQTINTIDRQPQVIVSQKQGQTILSTQRQQLLVPQSKQQPMIVSRQQPKTLVSRKQQPMVFSRKQREKIAQLPVVSSQQHHTIVSQPQLPVVSSQQHHTIISQPQLPVVSSQQHQTIVSQPQLPVVSSQQVSQPQLPVITSEQRGTIVSQPQLPVVQNQHQFVVSQTQPQTIVQQQQVTLPQSPPLVGQTTGNAIGQPLGTAVGAIGGTVVSQLGIVQNLSPVDNAALQQGTVQYIPTVDSAVVQPAATIPATAGTSDLVFEELVSAFTDVLQNPSGQTSQIVQTVPVVQIHNQHPQSALQNTIQLQSQPVLHQHGGMVQHGGMMQHGGMIQHGSFGGHMHGSQFGYMNPWMMARMNPSMMQEMMFGDTTDPPDPVATTTTTTVAPVTVANTVVAAADTSVLAAAASAAIATGQEPVAKSKAAPQPEVASAVKTLKVIPVTIKETSVVAEVPKVDVTITAKVIPKTSDIPVVPELAVPNQVQTNIQQLQSEAAVVDTNNPIVQTGNQVSKSKNTKAALSFEEKLMAEVTAMLSNTKNIDMSVISQVVGQVANELNGANVESIPSAVQLGLKTLLPDPSAKTLTKKEIVNELIGSTRGVVVYPPTPPSVTVVTKNNAFNPKLAITKVDTPKAAPVDLKNESKTKVQYTMVVLDKKPKVPVNKPTTKIPLHIEVPTLPPQTGSLAESPEVYRTLQTILDHNPSAIVQELEDTIKPKVEVPTGPKISVKSLVDTDPKSNLQNLQTILTDISSAVKVNTTNTSSSVIPTLRKNEIKVEPLKDTLLVNATNVSNISATVGGEPKMNEIKLQPIAESTTYPPTAPYASAESFSPSVPTMPSISTDVTLVTDSAIPTVGASTIFSQGFTEPTSTFDTTYQAWTVSTVSPFVDVSTMATTDVTGSSATAKSEGIPVNISENISTGPPKMANMEGIAVHVERVPTETPASENPHTSLDATGALAILKEIRSFNPNTSSNKHDDIAKKLSDPNFVQTLRGILKTMMNKASATTTTQTTPFWSETPEVTTMTFPISSTEEYEAEDFITETPAP